jgi:predicted nucleic acid-binding Zn ribbon protein
MPDDAVGRVSGQESGAVGRVSGQESTERRLRSAKEALADAIDDARQRGERPAPRSRADPGVAGARLRNSTESGQRTPPGADDPKPLGEAIRRLLAERGWQQQAAVGSAIGRWAEIVGPELAAHAKPDGFTDGELVVIADSTAWATQLRLLAGPLVKRLNAELGDGTVKRVKVRGPAGPPRQPGAWRTPGSRGPRDTYG